MIRVVNGNRISEKDLLQIIGVITKEISDKLINIHESKRGFKYYDICIDVKVKPVQEACNMNDVFMISTGL